MSFDADKEIRAQFRAAFIEDRMRFVREHGPASFDQGRVLYRCVDTGRAVVVSDAFLQGSDAGDITRFMNHLQSGWWSSRAEFSGDEAGANLERVLGLYARFLPEVGYDFFLEFHHSSTDNPIATWRIDPSGRSTGLAVPADELMFHGQTGTFFNLRAGWRALVDAHIESDELVVNSVESGYVIGVRRGDPTHDDPINRPDPELEHAFSQYVDYGFDTVEFIGASVAEKYPFAGERYTEWLGHAVAQTRDGTIELFVLASSEAFIAVIDEVCAQRNIGFQYQNEHESLQAILTLGPLSIDLDLGTIFLRTIHTGRSFASGVRDFLIPSLEALESGNHLYTRLGARIPNYTTSVEDGCVLVISDPDTDRVLGRWNVFSLSGLSQEHGQGFVDSALKFLGFDPQTGILTNEAFKLDQCSVCQRPARVGKVIRPTAALGIDPRRLLGVPVGDHTVYFTLECSQHVLPISPQPSLSISDLEQAYRERVADSVLTIVSHRNLDPEIPATIIVAYDAGSLVLEVGRVRAVMDALDISYSGPISLYGFFPDALVIADRVLTGAECRLARSWAHEIIEPMYPTRMLSLDVSRQVSLDEEPIGQVDFMA